MNALPSLTSAEQSILLSDLSVIAFSGEDATTFLQGQLSNDVNATSNEQAQLTSYCSAKGRVLATLLLWTEQDAQEGQRYLALVKADIADALVKRLSMFVLRAKVLIKKTSLIASGVLENNTSEAKTYSVQRQNDQTQILAPSHESSVRRWWCISNPAQQETKADVTLLSYWQSLDIRAGLPWVTQDVQDLFIPQTLNLDLIGAVNFTKGCYPGQEVVARSHYRGTIKRRMAFGLTTANQVLPTTDIFDANKPDNPCGRVINVAQDPEGKTCLLLEVQLADLDTANFRLGTATGDEIAIQALPYDIRQLAG